MPLSKCNWNKQCFWRLSNCSPFWWQVDYLVGEFDEFRKICQRSESKSEVYDVIDIDDDVDDDDVDKVVDVIDDAVDILAADSTQNRDERNVRVL